MELRVEFTRDAQALVAVVKLFADAKAGGRGYAAALGKPPARRKRA